MGFATTVRTIPSSSADRSTNKLPPLEHNRVRKMATWKKSTTVPPDLDVMGVLDDSMGSGELKTNTLLGENDDQGEKIVSPTPEGKPSTSETDDLADIIEKCHVELKEFIEPKRAKDWLKDPELYKVLLASRIRFFHLLYY